MEIQYADSLIYLLQIWPNTTRGYCNVYSNLCKYCIVYMYILYSKYCICIHCTVNTVYTINLNPEISIEKYLRCPAPYNHFKRKRKVVVSSLVQIPSDGCCNSFTFPTPYQGYYMVTPYFTWPLHITVPQHSIWSQHTK